MVIESIGPVMKALALLWIFQLGGGGFPTMHSMHMRRSVRVFHHTAVVVPPERVWPGYRNRLAPQLKLCVCSLP